MLEDGKFSAVYLEWVVFVLWVVGKKMAFSSRLKWKDVEYIKSTSELTISH